MTKSIIDIDDLTQSVIDGCAARAKLKNIEVMCLVAEGAPARVSGDSATLRHALEEMLAQAISCATFGDLALLVSREGERDGAVLLKFAVAAAGAVPEKNAAEGVVGTLGTYGVEALPGQGFTLWCQVAVNDLQGQREWSGVQYSGKRVLVVDESPWHRELMRQKLRLFSIEADAPAPAEVKNLDLSGYDLIFVDRRSLSDFEINTTSTAGARVVLTYFIQAIEATLGKHGAVPAFLNKPIPFAQIYRCLAGVFPASKAEKSPSPDQTIKEEIKVVEPPSQPPAAQPEVVPLKPEPIQEVKHESLPSIGDDPPTLDLTTPEPPVAAPQVEVPKPVVLAPSVPVDQPAPEPTNVQAPVVAPAAQPEAEPPPPPLPKPAAAPLSAKEKSGKILLCDDDAISVELMQHSLEGWGFSVLTAFNGEDGLSLIRSERPVVVILDINMPIRDGIGVLRDLQEKPMSGAVPKVMILSNHESKKMRDLCTSLGATDVMIKPFRLLELKDKIERLLREGGAS